MLSVLIMFGRRGKINQFRRRYMSCVFKKSKQRPIDLLTMLDHLRQLLDCEKHFRCKKTNQFSVSLASGNSAKASPQAALT